VERKEKDEERRRERKAAARPEPQHFGCKTVI
jgi:hypothetical protein